MSKKLGARQKLNKTNLNKVPAKPGVYLIRNNQGDTQYIGMTKTLRTRIGQHISQRDIPGADTVQFRTSTSVRQAARLEGKYIEGYKPKYNIHKNK